MNKIIGAGFGRTGTTSLKNALTYVGLGPCYHMHELFNNPHHISHWETALRGRPTALLGLMRTYRSMVDFPVCSYYQTLYEHFPGSKVILAYRDPEQWYESISRTIFTIDWENWAPLSGLDDEIDRIGAHNEELINLRTFGTIIHDKARCIEIYVEHARSVRASIPASDLLVFRLEEGWKPLCDFLRLDQPEAGFPHENPRVSFKGLIDECLPVSAEPTHDRVVA